MHFFTCKSIDFFVAKPVDNQEIAEYMEHLSKRYFSQIFPNSNISTEPKAKAEKQDGHVVVIDFSKAVSTDIFVKVIHKFNI